MNSCNLTRYNRTDSLQANYYLDLLCLVSDNFLRVLEYLNVLEGLCRVAELHLSEGLLPLLEGALLS